MNIFIASSSLIENEEYLKLANDVSKELSKYYNLICGGVGTSMMKVIFDNFKENDKKVTCVTLDLYNEDLSMVDEKYLMSNTVQRLEKIYELSDIFLILPGGSGTYSEMFGILEEIRTKENNKKLYVYNYKGFYDNILNILNKSVNEGFNNKEIFNYIKFIDNINEIKKEG